jgi:spore maturation protein CgeB
MAKSETQPVYLKNSWHSTQQKLPERFTMENLEANLGALAKVNGDLVRRICLPVEGGHVQFGQTGKAQYQQHRTLLPFSMGKTEARASLGDLTLTEHIVLFGIGLGEQLDHLLQHSKQTKITVWDRDPWLVRLVLMQKNYRSEILSGRVMLCMGGDIVDLVDQSEETTVVCHPVLCHIYDSEYTLMRDGIEEERALVCAGNLFVDDIKNLLKQRGISVFTLHIQRLSLTEIERTIDCFKPQFVFAVNYTNGLSELCHKHHVKLICWIVDPFADHLKKCRLPTDQAYMFTYRKAGLRELAQVGFEHAEYLPLATDPEKRTRAASTETDKTLYGSQVSFVGSSMIDQARNFRKTFLAYYSTYKNNECRALEEGVALLEKILAEQRRDYSSYRIPELMQHHMPGFIDYMHGLDGGHDPYMLVGEIGAAEKRVNYIAQLEGFQMKVWGDPGWQAVTTFGIQYMGPAGHTCELNKIYSGSVINVDIGRLYQGDIVTMRVFDVLACGGFVLAEWSQDLEDLFVVGKEVETYRTVKELVQKSAYYMAHSDKALEIARRGQETVRKKHTIAQRMGHMLSAACLGCKDLH